MQWQIEIFNFQIDMTSSVLTSAFKRDLQSRTKQFGLRVIRLVDALPRRKADESLYWMEMLLEAGLVSKTRIASLIDEAHQLIAILTASQKTARTNGSTRNSKIEN